MDVMGHGSEIVMLSISTKLRVFTAYPLSNSTTVHVLKYIVPADWVKPHRLL